MRFILVLATFLAAAVANPLNPDGAPNAKRNLVKRATCPANGAVATSYTPYGSGPVPTPNSPNDFTAYTGFAAEATGTAARNPTGFRRVFANLHASTSQDGYLGSSELSIYSAADCAAACNNFGGCNAFNIFFERDPITSCPNPPGTTRIRYVVLFLLISSSLSLFLYLTFVVFYVNEN